MKNQSIAITKTAKKYINKETWNSSFQKLTNVGMETLAWDKLTLTKQTKPTQLSEKQSESEVEQFPSQINSLGRQKTIILEELDELLEEVESFLLEEENSLDKESESFFSHEQLELKELVEELEVSVKEL